MSKKAFLLVAMTVSVAAAPARADTMSPQLCGILIETARARFADAWEYSWRDSDLPAIRQALYGFVARLSPVDKELIRAYEKGKVSYATFDDFIFEKTRGPGVTLNLKNGGFTDIEPRHGEGSWRLNVFARAASGHWLDRMMDVSLMGSSLDRAAVDAIIQRELVLRVSQRLGAGVLVYTPTQYIRYHQNIPDECFPGGVVPLAAKSDSDTGGVATYEPTVPAVSKGTVGKAAL